MILGQQCHTLALLPADQPDPVLLLSVSFPTGVAAQPSSTYKEGEGTAAQACFLFVAVAEILVRPCVVVAFVLCFSSFLLSLFRWVQEFTFRGFISIVQGLIGSVRVLGRTLF